MMARTLIVLALVAQAAAAVKFDSGRAWADLRQLVAIGPRPAGSAGIEQSRKYMKDQLAAAGVAVAEQAWDDETPLGKVRMVNLVATIPGARKERLVIAGHYDTKLFRQFRFVGASDGGSSAAFLLELARVFKARRNPLTIELLFLDGEEAVVEWRGTDHTYGSRHYVEVARKDGSLSSLKALILIDMIGDRDLQIRRDTNSTAWLTDTIWETARRQQLDNVFIAESATIEDDHLPFLQAGVPAVQIIDLDYEPWHTPRDTLEAVSARSLQIVGDVLLAALPQIEARIDPEHRGKRGRSRDKALERLDARLSHELLVGVKGKRTRG
jgi:glutaminyl-peptide cyclotransferase